MPHLRLGPYSLRGVLPDTYMERISNLTGFNVRIRAEVVPLEETLHVFSGALGYVEGEVDMDLDKRKAAIRLAIGTWASGRGWLDRPGSLLNQIGQHLDGANARRRRAALRAIIAHEVTHLRPGCWGRSAAEHTRAFYRLYADTFRALYRPRRDLSDLLDPIASMHDIGEANAAVTAAAELA